MKLAAFHTQLKPQAFQPRPGLQQSEALIFRLFLLCRKYHVIQVWEEMKMKHDCLCQKLSPAHHQKLSPAHHQHDVCSCAALPPRSSSRGELCIFSKHYREMKRLMEQEKPMPTSKSVTATAPLQSFRQRIVYLHPSPQLPGESTLF